MERIIIFRGKRVDTGELVYGDLLHGVNHKAGKIFILPIRGGVMGLGRGEDPLDGYEVVPESVGQNTGLKDKNGKEIYEGDIGRIATQSGRIENFVVKWGIHRRDMASGWTVDIPGFAFIIDGKPTFPIANNYLNGHDLDIIEIIGNVHENPELLNS